MAKLKVISNPRVGEPDYYFDCLGCKCSHGIWVNTHPNGSGWKFNGDIGKPTVTPSILVAYPWFKQIVNGVGVSGTEYKHVCHTFIKDGKIEYLNDCTHELAGQTIELPEVK